MFLLLAAASALCILLGEWQEGIVHGVAMVLVSGISIYQSLPSDRALLALRKLKQPMASVMRAGQLAELAVKEIMVGCRARIRQRSGSSGTENCPHTFFDLRSSWCKAHQRAR